MNVNEQIKLLRKDYLNFTQEEFAVKIKISRSNLGSIEVGRINVTDRVIDDICREFNVNEDWLRHGQGEMFIEPGDFSLDEYAEKSNLSELEIDLVKGYMDLSVSSRTELLSYLKSTFDKHSELAATKEDCIDAEVESYRLELEAEQKGATLLASEDSKDKVN